MEGAVKRGVGILVSGALMLVAGHLASQWILDNIPTVNPSHSSMMSDTQYHMLDWSNQLTTLGQWGIVVLVIGGFVTVLDMVRHTQQ